LPAGISTFAGVDCMTNASGHPINAMKTATTPAAQLSHHAPAGTANPP
jgi:hypothetical protein